MERLVKYIVVPIDIWENKELSWNEKALFIEIDSFTKRGKPCFISNAYIADLLGIAETNASKVIGRLIKKGFIRVVSFDGRHRYVESCLEAGLTQTSSLGCRESQPSLDDTSNIVTNKENTICAKTSDDDFSANEVLFGNTKEERMCDEGHCLEESTPTSHKHPSKERPNTTAGCSLEQRTAKFKQKCYAHVDEFGEKLIEDFFLYWSETKEGGRLMRWEKESTFDIHRRMCRWRNNNFGNRYSVSVEPRRIERTLTNEEIERVMNWRRDD